MLRFISIYFAETVWRTQFEEMGKLELVFRVPCAMQSARNVTRCALPPTCCRRIDRPMTYNEIISGRHCVRAIWQRSGGSPTDWCVVGRVLREIRDSRYRTSLASAQLEVRYRTRQRRFEQHFSGRIMQHHHHHHHYH